MKESRILVLCMKGHIITKDKAYKMFKELGIKNVRIVLLGNKKRIKRNDHELIIFFGGVGHGIPKKIRYNKRSFLAIKSALASYIIRDRNELGHYCQMHNIIEVYSGKILESKHGEEGIKMVLMHELIHFFSYNFKDFKMKHCKNKHCAFNNGFKNKKHFCPKCSKRFKEGVTLLNNSEHKK